MLLLKKQKKNNSKTIKLQEQVRIMYFLSPRIHNYSFKNNKKTLKAQRTILMGYTVDSPHPSQPFLR